MRTLHPLRLLLVCTLSVVAISADAPPSTPAPADAPKSPDAKRAAATYARAIREASAVFDRSSKQARDQYVNVLKGELDKALTRKNLDDANRIKSVIADMEAAEPQRTSQGVPVEELLNQKLRRFRVGGVNDCTVTLRPDGKVESTHTGWTQWKVDGDELLLGNPEGKDVGRFAVKRGVLVLYTRGATTTPKSYVLMANVIDPAATTK